MSVFVSQTCLGETCRCGAPAVAKIGEEIAPDDPMPNRHNLTAYVCARHYALLLGPAAARQVGYDPAKNKPDEPVIDRARLTRIRAAAQSALEMSPTPWRHTERTRTVHGNETGYLADSTGAWIATFDGDEENDFSAEVDPAVAMALVDLVEAFAAALDLSLEYDSDYTGAVLRLSCGLAERAGFKDVNVLVRRGEDGSLTVVEPAAGTKDVMRAFAAFEPQARQIMNALRPESAPHD